MREPADGNLVDAGLCDGPDGAEGDAARRFEPRAPLDEGGCGAKLFERHVVEEDRVDADGERFTDLLQRVALDVSLELT